MPATPISMWQIRFIAAPTPPMVEKVTDRNYFYDDALEMEASVLECSPDGEGAFRVRLNATLFHPQGGGQRSDRGTIGGRNVLRVTLEGEEIVHIVEAEVPSGRVALQVDPQTRRLHTRLHSAGHLISSVVERNGWYATKGHHWPGEARLVFEPRVAPKSPSLEELEAAVNAWVDLDLPLQVAMLDGMRAVGFRDFPLRNCGGTHVKSAGQIGKVKILTVKKKKGTLSVQYDLFEEQ